MRGVLLGWAAVGLLLALLAQVAFETLWIFAFVPLFLWAVAGLAILAVASWRARNPDQRHKHLLIALAVILGWLVFVPIATTRSVIRSPRRFAFLFNALVTTKLSLVRAQPPPNLDFGNLQAYTMSLT